MTPKTFRANYTYEFVSKNIFSFAFFYKKLLNIGYLQEIPNTLPFASFGSPCWKYDVQ